ncbi:ATP-dependent RNA helicase DbpA [Pollutimonas thiosulfatoxidans]|uniref:ATP-dependent RNA helicase DbpA n=1 Tax=Pollutimonas thiosulfatoxidans TaxID=2028345 RepID=A0A410GBL1_9BURK|nr:ATP-dependent RNA helicase DbpA [Pollutimonas thiosulfatoxidans]MBF6617823.1 ATP-dependent RNA helicase DbpA [Candidimonas sp.]NYT46132.1 ATP-dependent RNA helicase DbpA [Alcaligenaceae bacterium]QAA93673.1 ATP-dependent RNA helicase DbpA [Pollutimonas thiosulfatoxidans]
MTSPLFSLLPLGQPVLDNLDAMQYHSMTPIQAASLPLILEGRDIVAQAKTGSGKTAAFGLGIVHRLEPTAYHTQALVLCPTRELAEQVANELRRLARALGNIKILTLCGGTPIRPQVESLKFGAHVLVGTPGRIMDHIDRQTVDLGAIHTLVLDEADRMLDMGFFDDVAKIVRNCPATRQTLLFSATYADDIRKASARFLKQPAQVKVESVHDAGQIVQYFYEVEGDKRLAAVAQLLEHFRPGSTLAFCNTKAQCRDLAQFLQARGFSALALHGDLEQRDREDVLVQFANRSCSVLVATDVAARGLDIDSLDAVINAEITPDPEVHIHRIGRTGRGDASGLALSLCAPHELRWANQIEQYQGQPIQWAALRALKPAAGGRLRAPMVTLCIQGGKKDKLRPGDLLGALTKDAGFEAAQIGKINILDQVSFVALERHIARQAHDKLSSGNIKGRRFKMRFMAEV